MSNKIIESENLKIVTMEHDIRIEGRCLSEKKQKIAIDSENGSKRLIFLHLRRIDNKNCNVTEIFSNGHDVADDRKVETDMTEDEVKQFEKDWIKYWRPEITSHLCIVHAAPCDHVQSECPLNNK